MASTVDVVNLALLKLGNADNYLTALTDSTKEARAATKLWTHIRDLVLKEADWPCTIKRSLLRKSPSAIRSLYYWSTKDMFIGVGDNGLIMYSYGGIHEWTIVDSGVSTHLNSVCLLTSTLIAVGESGVILTSTDGLTWTARTSGTTKHLYGVCVKSTSTITACAVGAAGAVLTSTDGTTWTVQDTSEISGATLRSVATDNTVFVAVGDGGIIYSAPTTWGVWTSRTSGVTTKLFSVCYGSSLWVAVGEDGVILTSADYTTWVARTGASSEDQYAVAYKNSTYYTCGASGSLQSSSDGTTWTGISIDSSANLAIQDSLYSIEYSASLAMVIMVGNDGVFINSRTFDQWNVWSMRYMGHEADEYGSGLYVDETDSANWTKLVVMPSYGKDYKYPLPQDCLRVISLSESEYQDESDFPWTRERDYIITSASEVYCRYVFRNTDTTTWSIELIEAVAARLAMALAPSIEVNKQAVQMAQAEYLASVTHAKGTAYKEQFVEGKKSRWEDAGRS